MMIKKTVITALAVLSALPLVNAQADTLDLNLSSHHGLLKHSSERFNEANLGLGYTKTLGTDYRASMGYYKNSYSKPTWYAMVDYGTGYGVFLGAATGYREQTGLTVSPVGGLWANLGNFTLRYIPPVKPKGIDLITIQYRIEL